MKILKEEIRKAVSKNAATRTRLNELVKKDKLNAAETGELSNLTVAYASPICRVQGWDKKFAWKPMVTSSRKFVWLRHYWIFCTAVYNGRFMPGDPEVTQMHTSKTITHQEFITAKMCRIG